MKLGDFTSEYESADLPVVSGEPMKNAALDQQVGAMTPARRVEESLVNVLSDAVFLYYFVKRVWLPLDIKAAAHKGPLRSALEATKSSLVKQAVIGIASTIDLTRSRDSALGRTRSIPHALDALEVSLTNRLRLSPDEETQAAVDLLRHIRGMTNVDRVVSLKYVRHLRNKWAGHSSLDRTFDSWADADNNVSFPLLEDALVRMVNACQELGNLSPMSRELQQIESQSSAGVGQPAGTRAHAVSVYWSGMSAMAVVMRGAGQAAGEALVAQLA